MYRCLVCCYENDRSFLHCIPKNNARREKWLTSINCYSLIKKPISYFKYYRVCGRHFSPDMYTFKGSQKLNTNAVPDDIGKSSESTSIEEAIDTSIIMSRDKKRCLVPQCTNDSHCAPNKYFVRFPRNAKMRQKWCESINVDAKIISPTNSYICEDHFSLEDNAENWMYFITIGSKLILKKDVVPHRNIHQLDIDIPISVSQISPLQKKRKKINIQKFIERKFILDDKESSCSSIISESFEASPNRHNVFVISTSSLQPENINVDTSERLSEDFNTNDQRRNKSDTDKGANVDSLQYIKTEAFEEIIPKEERDNNEDYLQEKTGNKSVIGKEPDLTDRLQYLKTEAFEEIKIKEEIDDNEQYLQEIKSNKSVIGKEADVADRLQYIKTEAFEEILIKVEEMDDNAGYLQEYE